MNLSKKREESESIESEKIQRRNRDRIRMRKTAVRSQGSVSETSSESSRPGSAPGRATSKKENRSDESFPGRNKRVTRTQEIPETEHPVHIRLGQLLAGGLNPNEAHGVVALISSMRLNGNVMMKTEAVEGTERISVFEEEEGWSRNDLVETEDLIKEYPAGKMNVPKKVFYRKNEESGMSRAVQTSTMGVGSSKSTQTEVREPMTPEERSESPGIPVVESSTVGWGEPRTPGGSSTISRPQSLKLSEISSGRSSAAGNTESPIILPGEGSPESNVEEWLMTPGKFRRSEDEVEHEKTPTKETPEPHRLRCWKLRSPKKVRRKQWSERKWKRRWWATKCPRKKNLDP